MAWYTGDWIYDTWLLIGFLFAAFVLIAARYGTAAYGGRFGVPGRGFKMGSKAGWVTMEVPALLFFPLFFFMGQNADQAVPLFFLAIWTLHYTNRALVTPLLMRPRSEQGTFDLSVVLLGWLTLILHSYLNATYFTTHGDYYQLTWFSDPRFVLGLIIYAGGLSLNIISDATLRNLRSKNPAADEARYKVPYGGGFKWVSCPQYLGEIIAFTGFAIMVWHLGALFVLAVTLANLIPRALHTHQWFQKNFADYPAERKAIIPFLL